MEGRGDVMSGKLEKVPSGAHIPPTSASATF